MTPFIKMNAAQMAKILAEWFPEEVSPFLKMVNKKYALIHDNKREEHSKWDNQNIPFGLWLRFMESINHQITKYADTILTPIVFSNQLFQGPSANWTLHCLIDYAVNSCNNQPFRDTVLLFFSRLSPSVYPCSYRFSTLRLDLLQSIKLTAKALLDGGQFLEFDFYPQELGTGYSKLFFPENLITGIRVTPQEVWVKFKNQVFYMEVNNDRYTILDFYLILAILHEELKTKSKKTEADAKHSPK